MRLFLVFFLLFAAYARFVSAVDFNRDVRPILSDNCFQCHGPDEHHREADLRLDIEAEAKAYAIELGNLESEFMARIMSDDVDTIMPPPDSGKELTEAEKQTLRDWILSGAKWQQHWAYEMPQWHAMPETSQTTTNFVDNFLFAELEKQEQTPTPPADRVTLVRRLYFDLLGLPPSPEDVEQFLSDHSSGAYAALVDRLLESPNFGERMAIYWLDLVRYADTVGYHGDQDHNISPYRDYVIDAFNHNVPFDQFTREQLAGDLLDNPTIDQQVATGYNRLLQTSHEGGVQPAEYLAIYQADRVRNVSAVWLGGTLGCAQCHNHKYDPYTAHDFYAMAAFFADIDEAQHFKKGTNSLPTARPPEIDVLRRGEREEYARLERKLSELEESCEDAEQAQATQIRKRLKTLERQRRRTMVTVALDEPREVRFLPRGNWLDDSGPVMKPAVPKFLGELPTDRRPTRLDLAHWLVDTEEGVGLLTARVMANRFWYLLFGRGLSPSLDDFGGQGHPPSHPELLDNLAIEFAKDWNVKRLVKFLVMSKAYRQSSAATPERLREDPDNHFFARQSRHRLPAEMIRDTALSVSGLLVNDFGGASVKPYQPLGYYRHLNFPQRRYAHHGDQRQWRRGVYVHWQRQFLHPMLKAFDAPTREECTAQRPRSNTPLAALVMLNDPTFVEAARALAVRVLSETDTDQQRLERMMQCVVSRDPNELERKTLLDLLKSSRDEYQQSTESAESVLSIGESVHGHDSPGELAAWTSVARVVLNLSEATTRQ